MLTCGVRWKRFEKLRWVETGAALVSRALVEISPHAVDGPFILDREAHVIVYSDAMCVEVHICGLNVVVLTAADGTCHIEGCECGTDHHYLTAHEYLEAAERQGIPVDYI